MFKEPSSDRMSGLVVGHGTLLLGLEDVGSFLETGDNTFNGGLEVLMNDRSREFTSGDQS